MIRYDQRPWEPLWAFLIYLAAVMVVIGGIGYAALSALHFIARFLTI